MTAHKLTEYQMAHKQLLLQQQQQQMHIQSLQQPRFLYDSQSAMPAEADGGSSHPAFIMTQQTNLSKDSQMLNQRMLMQNQLALQSFMIAQQTQQSQAKAGLESDSTKHQQAAMHQHLMHQQMIMQQKALLQHRQQQLLLHESPEAKVIRVNHSVGHSLPKSISSQLGHESQAHHQGAMLDTETTAFSLPDPNAHHRVNQAAAAQAQLISQIRSKSHVRTEICSQDTDKKQASYAVLNPSQKKLSSQAPHYSPCPKLVDTADGGSHPWAGAQAFDERSAGRRSARQDNGGSDRKMRSGTKDTSSVAVTDHGGRVDLIDLLDRKSLETKTLAVQHTKQAMHVKSQIAKGTCSAHHHQLAEGESLLEHQHGIAQLRLKRGDHSTHDAIQQYQHAFHLQHGHAASGGEHHYLPTITHGYTSHPAQQPGLGPAKEMTLQNSSRTLTSIPQIVPHAMQGVGGPGHSGYAPSGSYSPSMQQQQHQMNCAEQQFMNHRNNK